MTLVQFILADLHILARRGSDDVDSGTIKLILAAMVIAIWVISAIASAIAKAGKKQQQNVTPRLSVPTPTYPPPPQTVIPLPPLPSAFNTAPPPAMYQTVPMQAAPPVNP